MKKKNSVKPRALFPKIPSQPLPGKVSARLLSAAFAFFVLTALPLPSPAKPPKEAPVFKTWTEPRTAMVFVKIDGGCYEMGQTENEKNELLRDAGWARYEKYYADELPRHKVCVDDFWMGKFEVTNHQWKKIMADLPSGNEGDDNSPVEKISFENARQFIDTLNARGTDYHFRLPTEAEWEYAARAGTTTAFFTGEIIGTSQANYNGNFSYGLSPLGEYLGKPVSVGNYPANPFGLHDLHGNLWEWCSDWYEKDYYAKSPEQNPTGPEKGNFKVMRGGSWFVAPRSIRAANRHGIEPDKAVDDYGFRLVAEPAESKLKPSDFNQDF